jgi:choline dehydrogenase-like flavoprotein
LDSLYGGSVADDSCEIAAEVVEFMLHVPSDARKMFGFFLSWLNLYSIRYYRRPFYSLNCYEIRALLNQGETPVVDRSIMARRHPPILSYDGAYAQHTAVSLIAMLVRMVTHSRTVNRRYVGMTWSPECRDPTNLVHVPPPPKACLDDHYDVCVIGSGAGGSLVAARAAAAGKRVLIVESGDWKSPDALVQRHVGVSGKEELQPARDDRVLIELYQNAGLQIARDSAAPKINAAEFLLPQRRKNIQPFQSVNVLQANVVGGGPYVNNAIHLPIKSHVWDRWAEATPGQITYQQFLQRSRDIQSQLGVNEDISRQCASLRSQVFADGCSETNQSVTPLPVSVRPQCQGCGSDNSVDPFGSHIGGLHPFRPNEPNSFLMQSLNAPVPAAVAWRMRASHFEIQTNPCGNYRAVSLVVEDRDNCSVDQTGILRRVHADEFVLSAGPVASTRILHKSYSRAKIINDQLGHGFNGNVGCPVYALFEKPLVDESYDRPEPGIAQCFLADEILDTSTSPPAIMEPGLENWFHYPGTVALAVTGWFEQYARVMKCFNRLSIAGMFVPTQVRPENRVEPEKIYLSLNPQEFELICRGIERIAKIYLAVQGYGQVEIFLPTKGMLLDHCGAGVKIVDHQSLNWAMEQIRRRGPAFISLLSSHPQGGNALAAVVDKTSFNAMDQCGRQVTNLKVADASVFPHGCQINPQLTVKTIASLAADVLLRQQPTAPESLIGDVEA